MWINDIRITPTDAQFHAGVEMEKVQGPIGAVLDIKDDRPPRQRKLNSELWTVHQKLLTLLGVDKDDLDVNYAQGKFWFHHKLNTNEGGFLMVRSIPNTNRYHVNRCAWVIPEARQVLHQIRTVDQVLGSVDVNIATEKEMWVIMSNEASQAQA